MYLVVGLGNPGIQYVSTRHNVGFMYLDYLAEVEGFTFSFDKKFNGDVAKDDEFIYLKPHTFMNNSGDSVSKAFNYFEIDDVVVVHDELDLELGSYKFQRNRGDAGHNGVKDIFEKLNTRDFYRLRLGIGKTPVLGKFTHQQLEILTQGFKAIELSTLISG
jgi:peptidyl-tRNA hydrolase, PTH1 family